MTGTLQAFTYYARSGAASRLDAVWWLPAAIAAIERQWNSLPQTMQGLDGVFGVPFPQVPSDLLSVTHAAHDTLMHILSLLCPPSCDGSSEPSWKISARPVTHIPIIVTALLIGGLGKRPS